MRTKSSRSENGAHSLSSVMQDYAQLVRRWSALSMTIRSARHAGLQVSLRPSDAPELRVSQAPVLSHRTGEGTGTYIDTRPSVDCTTYSSWTTNGPDISPQPGPSTLVRRIPVAPMGEKSSSSKRVICRSGVRRSSK